MDEKSLDVLGVRPVAKALEHASTKTVDGISSFFAAICMPAAEEFGLMLRDRVAEFRQRNLAGIAEKTKLAIKRVQVLPTGDCNPRLIHEAIEQGSWTDDACAQEMWAGLIAAASGTAPAADDSLIYTETLRRLTPFQARLLNHIYGDPRSCAIRSTEISHEETYTPSNRLSFRAREILELYPEDLSKFVNIVGVTHEDVLEQEATYALALARFRPQIDALVTLGLVRYASLANSGKDGVHFLPSLKGLDLYMRGLGYKIYPLEAFIVTQQHWCALRGIDPFTYRQA